MPDAVLSEPEKARVRYHLGYLNTDPVSSIQLGFPRASQAQFLVEAALNRIPETAVGIVRRHIAILDQIEDRLIDALDRLQASKLEDITLRPDEHDATEREYYRWAMRLADNLGVPLNTYSERFRSKSGMTSLSVPVHS